MEMKSKQRKRRTSQSKMSIIVSQLSSLKTPKDMINAMNNLYKDDLENSTQGCEGAMSENIQYYFTKRSQLKVEDNVKEAEA